MKFIKRLFSSGEVLPPAKIEKYHCVRFMTEKGEQLGLLLTHEEFERAVFRWVQTIESMPIQEDPEQEGMI
jgi:hypothetical protein